MQKKLARIDRFIEDCRGFGIEDAPFQILAAVLVLVATAVIGVHLWGVFDCGNQCSDAADTALEIHKYADILSAGSSGSQRILSCRVPEGFEIEFVGGAVILDGTQNKCGCIGVKTLNSSSFITGPALGPGYHKLKLVFSVDENGSPNVKISELPV